MTPTTLAISIITALLFAIIGFLSVFKPKIIGTEFAWIKSNRFYTLKFKEPTNPFYLRYIQYIGAGFIASSIIMCAVIAVKTMS